MLDNEPSLSQIDDYNNNESDQKRKTINIVIALCLIAGLGFAILKYTYNDVSDYTGTKELPGINTTKGF